MVLGLTTLILGPLIAVSVMDGGSAVATRTPAARPAASYPTRIPAVAVPDIIDRSTPSPDPATPPPTPVQPRVAAAPPAIPHVAPADPNTVIGIIQAAAARWGVSGDWMVKIARCESGLRPNAYNPRGPYIGLFQFLQSTFTHNGGTNIWDAADQANIAAKMLAHGQAYQWSCA
ncbi:MAG: transglycosylase SLT domain-containing protein [Candidatus Dormibacteria bacterium]